MSGLDSVVKTPTGANHLPYGKMGQRFPAGWVKIASAPTLTSFKLSDVEVVSPNEATAVLMYHVKQTMALRGKTEGVTQEMTDSSTWVHTERIGWVPFTLRRLPSRRRRTPMRVVVWPHQGIAIELFTARNRRKRSVLMGGVSKWLT